MIKRRNKRYVSIFLAGIFLVALVLYLRPLPLVQPSAVPTVQPMVLRQVDLPWPATGQAAVGAVGYGLLSTSKSPPTAPMASTAKVMAALAVLDKKPLGAGQQGPMILITDDDMAYFRLAQSQGQSVLPVYTGEQISEYQALQALLIPSANNIAYSLATWAFGSADNYLAYANQKAKDLGLTNTHFADASGFSPQTTSTAGDLVLLGLAAMKNPVITSVVNQSQASLPGAGVVKNVNWLLGNEGIIGIKTGNTDQAGGCFLLAANRTVEGQPVTTIIAVLGAPVSVTAISSGKSLLIASDKGFSQNAISFTAVYKAPWGAKAIATKNISALTWQGLPIKVTSTLKSLPAGSPKGTLAGSSTLKNANYSKTKAVYLDQEIQKPTIWWRIFHW